MTSPDGISTPPPSSSAPLHYAPRPATSGLAWLSLLVGAAGLGCSVLLWQKVEGMQEQLARQSADATAQATEARALARQAQDLVRDANAKFSVMELRVNEVSLQREKLDTLVNNLTRSRDDTLLVDIESAIRMAYQQVQLTGSTDPLVATLQSSIKRLERAPQPRLIAVQKAMELDLERLSKLRITDTASLLARLDDVVRMVDDLHVKNSTPVPQSLRQPERTPTDASLSAPAASSPTEWLWWQQWGQRIWLAVQEEARDLLRVSRIDNPDAMLMAPEQAFFVRENIKLKLLNARLAILARQFDAARSDIGAVQAALGKYFDGNTRRIHQAQAVLAQLQTHLQASQQPRLDDTLAALATAAAPL